MRSCTHPGSAVGSRPCWRHQLTVCGLLFYLNPHSRIVFWSDCKSSNSVSETAQVLKLANGSAAIWFPTIYGELAHIVSLPERDWAQAASLSAQPGPNNMSNEGLNLWETQALVTNLWAAISTVADDAHVRQSALHPMRSPHVHTSWQPRRSCCSSLY